MLASERNNAARNEIRDWARDEGIPAYDRRAERGVLRNLVVREGRRTGQVQTRLVTSAGEIPQPPVDLHTIIEAPAAAPTAPRGRSATSTWPRSSAGCSFRISHRAFFQTNTEMAERLYGIASRWRA